MSHLTGKPRSGLAMRQEPNCPGGSGDSDVVWPFSVRAVPPAQVQLESVGHHVRRVPALCGRPEPPDSQEQVLHNRDYAALTGAPPAATELPVTW